MIIAEGSQIEIVNDSELRMLDADTIRYCGIDFRLAGYDAPESRSNCATEKRLARMACFRLAWLLRPHHRRQLFIVKRRDKYGRPVARLLIDNVDVAVTAVREGWGIPYEKGARAKWSSPDVRAARLAFLASTATPANAAPLFPAD